MDYEQLAKEMVRALRGTRSQAFCNRRLRCTTNVMHTWEVGARYPSATDFLRLARIARVDVQGVLQSFVTNGDVRVGPSVCTHAGMRQWLDILAEGRSSIELAGMIGRNRNTISRWLKGTSQPRFPDLLSFVQSTTQRLLEFVGAFVDPKAISSLAEAYADLELQRRLAYETPWSHAVLRVLELEDYCRSREHTEGFIADKIGISIEEERACIAALASAKQIQFRSGRWVASRILTVDTRKDADANRRLKYHWAEVGLNRLNNKTLPQNALFSYNLFAISNDGLLRVRKAHLKYYEELRSIVAECDKPTRVVLANIQLIPLSSV
jgi:transcriptional regulator with XRE-family HTH domain